GHERTSTPQRNADAERLKLLDENVEALREAGLRQVLTLDDRLVDTGPAVHVVGLDGQDLLKRMGGAVRLEGPDLHLAETLSAELRLAGEWLLRDERVRPDASRVNLVVHEMRELQHVDRTDRD